MKPFQIALFKHFLEQKGMVTIYINTYRRNHLKKNPASIEEFLKIVDVTEVCTKAFIFYINTDYGYDYWSKMELMWMEFLAANENNYTADEWYKLQGMSKILRNNWDAAKHWKQESKLTTAIRMGIDLKLIGAEECTPTAPPTKLSEEYLRETTHKEVMDFKGIPEHDADKGIEVKPKKEDTDIDFSFEDDLDGLNILDIKPRSHNSTRLKDDEISLNLRNKKSSITFNLKVSKEIQARGGYEYAAIANEKEGVCIVLNDAKGVPMLDGKSHKTGGALSSNACINSKVLCARLEALLNITEDYTVLKIREYKRNNNYVAYIVSL